MYHSLFLPNRRWYSEPRFKVFPLSKLRYVPPTAFQQQLFKIPREQRCMECQKLVDKIFRCATCQIARFCSQSCQRLNWSKHKPNCMRRNSFSERALVIEISCHPVPDEEWSWVFSVTKDHVFNKNVHPNNIYLQVTSCWPRSYLEIPDASYRWATCVHCKYPGTKEIIRKEIRQYLQLGLDPNDLAILQEDTDTQLLDIALSFGSMLVKLPTNDKYSIEMFACCLWIVSKGIQPSEVFSERYFADMCYVIWRRNNVLKECQAIGKLGMQRCRASGEWRIFPWKPGKNPACLDEIDKLLALGYHEYLQDLRLCLDNLFLIPTVCTDLSIEYLE